MHVPQGIAYALLAKVQPVVGLYTSFFPALLYMVFGTSMHNSIGSFAVVALMAGKSVTDTCGANPVLESTNATTFQQAEDYDHCAIRTASTLAFCVGLVHLLMGILRLEIVVTYFSDQLVSGFTTAASCHVFVTQLPGFFGIRGIPDHSGFGYLFKKLFYIITNIQNGNLATTLLGIFSILFLVVGKDVLNPNLKKKFKLPVPIPFELLLVVIATAFSKVVDLKQSFNVKIVEKIPTGLPMPQTPAFDQLGGLWIQGLSIAVVVVAIHISLAKMFAKKLNYKVDPGQDDFRDAERYKDIIIHKGICIFRFDAPLLFTNVEQFKENIQKAFELWKNQCRASADFPEELKIPQKDMDELSNVLTIHSLDPIEPEKPMAGLLYKHFIIDCSGFTFVDYMGVNALKEIFTEMRDQRVLVYFAAAKAPVRDLFEASGFYNHVAKCNFYPTIRDAISTAKKRRNASTLHLLDEIRIKHDTLDDVINAQPMN
uniref:STAS domain-containing protein n=1 Tax=Panagrolaimus sp. JU765 TaxID=591449 RepID=A0AC34RGV3_9BILA